MALASQSEILATMVDRSFLQGSPWHTKAVKARLLRARRIFSDTEDQSLLSGLFLASSILMFRVDCFWLVQF